MVSVLLVALPIGPVKAEDFVFPAGMWELIETITSNATGNPTTRTKTECRKHDYFSAEDLFEKDIDCHITELETSSTLYAYQMRCLDQGEEFSGSGRYEIDGDHFTGHLETQMSIQGQTLEISVDIVGSRLGDC